MLDAIAKVNAIAYIKANHSLSLTNCYIALCTIAHFAPTILGMVVKLKYHNHPEGYLPQKLTEAKSFI